MAQRLCAELLGEQSMWPGRYKIKHELGSGGMGTVYLAVDSHLKREVAIKFLIIQDLAEQHLLAEARAMEGRRPHCRERPDLAPPSSHPALLR